MISVLVKNLHWIIIAYAGFSLFTLYTEKSEAYESLRAQTPALKNKIAREKRNLSRIEEFKKNLSSTKQRVQEVVRQIEKAQRQLPSNVNDAQVQEMLSEIAEKLKMKSSRQMPGEESEQGFYFSKLYNFQARGTFLQTLIFFERLAKAERILNVKNFSIKHSEDDARSRFQIIDFEATVESFRYNPNYTEKSGVEEIESKYKVN